MNTIWKAVTANKKYEVSNTGEVRRADTKELLRKRNGIVQLGSGRNRSVAKMVWTAFKDEPVPGRIVKSDGDRNNCHVDNLERFSAKAFSLDVPMGQVCVDQPGEIWKPVPDFPHYEVSNQGRVRSRLLQFSGRTSKEWRIKAPGTVAFGYKYVILRKDGKSYNRKIHAMVLEAFVGARPTIDGERACTRHLNGDPSDNRVENLAWGTMKENMADKKLHGTENRPRGEKVNGAVFTDAQVAEFKERMAAGEWYRDIANEIDKPISSIYGIGVGKSWNHIKPELDCTPGLSRKGKVPAAAVEAVKNGARPIDVADKFGVSPSGITRAFRRATGMNPRQWAKEVAA